ncbi:MAG: glycerophosphodiester phosphodiesterase family protein [bacterium]
MKTSIIIAVIILLTILIFTYVGYYLINPSQKGQKIINNLSIPYPSVIAHRGASVYAPESTRAAFSLARKQGADYMEADIQRSSDGRIIIFHDRDLKRLSNVESVFPEREDYTVGNFTYEELQKLDTGSWFNERYPSRAKPEYEGLGIITLSELLDIAENGENKPGLFLEFKNPHLYPGIEEQTIEILRKKGWLDNTDIRDEISSSVKHTVSEELSDTVDVGKGPSRLVFISFDINSLDRVRKLVPEFPRILLINDNMVSRSSWSRWLNLARDRVDGLGPKGFVAWPWHITAAHDEGLFVAPFVINHAWQIKLLSHFRADAYITDNPIIILNFLGRLMELSPEN